MFWLGGPPLVMRRLRPVLLLLFGLAACQEPTDLVFPAAAPSDAQFEALQDSGHPGFWPYGVKGGGHPEGHRGWDLDAPEGLEILAAGTGRVKRADACGSGTPCSFGHFIVLGLEGGGTVSYHHTGPPLVEKGDRVVAGEPIATFVAYEPVAVVHFDLAVGLHKVCPEPYLSEEALLLAERWRSWSTPNPDQEDPAYLDDGRYAALCFEL